MRSKLPDCFCQTWGHFGSSWLRRSFSGLVLPCITAVYTLAALAVAHGTITWLESHLWAFALEAISQDFKLLCIARLQNSDSRETSIGLFARLHAIIDCQAVQCGRLAQRSSSACAKLFWVQDELESATAYEYHDCFFMSRFHCHYLPPSYLLYHRGNAARDERARECRSSRLVQAANKRPQVERPWEYAPRRKGLWEDWLSSWCLSSQSERQNSLISCNLQACIPQSRFQSRKRDFGIFEGAS